MIRSTILVLCFTVLLPLAAAPSTGAAGPDTATPAPLVETYESLAEAILATKQTEWNLVHSILAGTYRHAEGVMSAARAKLRSGKKAAAELETLAALVTQLGNEGDAAVAAVRKRLIEGGHHHHADGEAKGLYDEGFVIVTRDAKKVFLDAGKKIGKMTRGGDAAALEAEWSRVSKQFADLHPRK